MDRPVKMPMESVSQKIRRTCVTLEDVGESE
jgi:hypothetical protein